jgi:hypothetical protein
MQVPKICSYGEFASIRERLHQTTRFAHTGMTLPLEQGQKVTIKQLLEYQDRVNGHPKSHSAENDVPPVIQRAIPGLQAEQFFILRHKTDFLLSWAYVRVSEAFRLLRNSLEVGV